MVDIILLFILIIAILVGYRRGLMLQTLHLITAIASLFIAANLYTKLSEKLTMFVPYPSNFEGVPDDMIEGLANEAAFYNIVAFLFIFVVSKLILQVIASFFDFFAQIDVTGRIGRIIGCVLAVIEFHIIVVCWLYLLILMPIPMVQDKIAGSFVAQMMITKSPIITQMLYHWLEHNVFEFISIIF